MTFQDLFANPPKRYTLVPFWFLNDALEEDEIRRQIDDFEAHGVYGFIPHARIGLPDDIPFMSERWLHFVKVAVDHAAAKNMVVFLYDEGMYPSGSCAGQVAAANPRHATRCLERRKTATLSDDEELVAEIDGYAYVNTRSGGTIRGVQYGMDDGEPGAPPSGDILNPESVASFLHLVHDRYAETLKEHFGKTVQAIFTDEPSMLGRGHKRGVQPWTWNLETFLERLLGYDFTPHLPALWDDTVPGSARYRADFQRALDVRLREAYYAPYQAWCEAHGVALTGHPAGPMDMGTLRHFHIPGQDIVWRYIEPYQDKSLEGPQSTMAKCSASAQVNYHRERNANECFGAYGWDFTCDEMRWLTNWLLVRGVNLLMPHAFYYSVRDKRRDERPPDVGPNNTWWGDYRRYADYCRRLCWMLAEGRQVCSVAILCTPTQLPWKAARVLFEHQWDFNYLDTESLLGEAEVTFHGIELGNMRYKTLLVEDGVGIDPDVLARLKPLIDAGRAAAFGRPVPALPPLAATPPELMVWLQQHLEADVHLDPPNTGVRFHHVRHGRDHLYFFVNEGSDALSCALKTAARGDAQWWDPETGAPIPHADPTQLALAPREGRVLRVTGEAKT